MSDPTKEGWGRESGLEDEAWNFEKSTENSSIGIRWRNVEAVGRKNEDRNGKRWTQRKVTWT